MQPRFHRYFCLANITKIETRKRNKIVATPVLFRNRMLEEESLILLTHLKDTLKPNYERILEIFEEIEILKAKRQN